MGYSHQLGALWLNLEKKESQLLCFMSFLKKKDELFAKEKGGACNHYRSSLLRFGYSHQLGEGVPLYQLGEGVPPFLFFMFYLIILDLQPAYSQLIASLQPAYSQPIASLQPVYSQPMASLQPAYNQLIASLQPTYNQPITSLWPAYKVQCLGFLHNLSQNLCGYSQLIASL